MKKVLFGSTALLLTVTLFAQPQPHPGGPPTPPPVAERWRHDSTKLQLYVGLLPAQVSNVKAALITFYNDLDALMVQAKNTPPLPPAKADVDKLRTKRDDALKAVLNAQQFSRFQTFEKEFMPPPPKPPGPRKDNDHV